ncbi:hypothetical protein C6496_03250 [Candidatus Poribacteria bacterium]|nr:MAG: hypothetical protein C6496_03250 [Candidatus Poribacteria bacterium]
MFKLAPHDPISSDVKSYHVHAGLSISILQNCPNLGLSQIGQISRIIAFGIGKLFGGMTERFSGPMFDVFSVRGTFRGRDP